MVGVKGQDQGWAISQIHLIDYNFASNCHRDFKLGSYFSLWNAAPNMTLTLTLKSSTKVKIFETYQIRKTSQNMLGYYAQGIIYCWEVKGQGQGQAKGQIHLISYNFASNCHRDFKLGLYFNLWKGVSWIIHSRHCVCLLNCYCSVHYRIIMGWYLFYCLLWYSFILV